MRRFIKGVKFLYWLLMSGLFCFLYFSMKRREKEREGLMEYPMEEESQ